MISTPPARPLAPRSSHHRNVAPLHACRIPHIQRHHIPRTRHRRSVILSQKRGSTVAMLLASKDCVQRLCASPCSCISFVNSVVVEFRSAALADGPTREPIGVQVRHLLRSRPRSWRWRSCRGITPIRIDGGAAPQYICYGTYFSRDSCRMFLTRTTTSISTLDGRPMSGASAMTSSL